jgi:hypothetical protein
MNQARANAGISQDDEGTPPTAIETVTHQADADVGAKELLGEDLPVDPAPTRMEIGWLAMQIRAFGAASRHWLATRPKAAASVAARATRLGYRGVPALGQTLA